MYKGLACAVTRRRTIPPPGALIDSYTRFSAGLLRIAAEAALDEKVLIFPDLERLILAWVKAGHGRA